MAEIGQSFGLLEEIQDAMYCRLLAIREEDGKDRNELEGKIFIAPRNLKVLGKPFQENVKDSV
jgi:hypothetical protein